jgi:AraC-like DNA-binding protein
MELPTPLSTSSLVDLSGVDETLRAATWRHSSQAYFPGLSVRELRQNPAFGMIAGTAFGAGRLWLVLSPPLQVSYDPHGAEDVQIFSVMLQIKGSTLALQSGRRGLLRPGELCVIDSLVPFELEVVGVSSQIMILQMPRHAVIGRHPYLEQRTAEVFDPQESGTTLLRNVLLNVVESAHLLQSDQRGAALGAVVQLLGAPKMRRRREPEEIGWRVRAALALIDAELADPELDASRVADAQSISRRRLDEIMVAQVGSSIAAKIWLRRLEQAASDLLDERFASKTVTQIAFAAGFEDAAHFTRAFKRRYGCTPSEWRTAQPKH